MDSRQRWYVLLVLVAVALAAAYCAGATAPPEPPVLTPTPTELPPNPVEPVKPQPPDLPANKPPLNIGAVLEAFPLPAGYQELPVAVDAAIGYGYDDGLLGLIVAPVAVLDPQYQHPEGAGLGMPVGVAWRPNAVFKGTYVVSVDLASLDGGQATGFLIGELEDGVTEALPIVFSVAALQYTASGKLQEALSPVSATIRADQTCYLLRQDGPTPLARLCSAGEALLVAENPVDPEGARQTLIGQVDRATQLLTASGLLPPDQLPAAEQVIGDIERPSAIVECDPVDYDPPGSCATDLIAAPIPLSRLSAAGRVSGLAKALSQLQPNVEVYLGVLAVQQELPGVLLDGSSLPAGSYVVHTVTDANGNLIIPVMVSGVTADSQEIVDQPVISVEAPLVDSFEDAGVAEVAMCKLWKACLFWEKCSK